MNGLSQPDVAERAGVDETFVKRLVEQGILEPTEGSAGPAFRSSDVYRVRFVQSCERAGIPVESVGAALRAGRMSLAFMDQPSYRWASVTSKSFKELAQETGLRVEFLLAVEEAMGGSRPDPDDPTREDLQAASTLLQIAHAGGFSETVILRISRLYADATRRMAEAERYVWRTYLVSGRRTQLNTSRKRWRTWGCTAGRTARPPWRWWTSPGTRVSPTSGGIKRRRILLPR